MPSSQYPRELSQWKCPKASKKKNLFQGHATIAAKEHTHRTLYFASSAVINAKPEQSRKRLRSKIPGHQIQQPDMGSVCASLITFESNRFNPFQQ
jgi:hypothetical protein